MNTNEILKTNLIEDRLLRIGLTPVDYEKALGAFEAGSILELSDLVKLSEARILLNSEFKSPKKEILNVSQSIRDQIIFDKLNELTPSNPSYFRLVVGLPGSGKSTFINKSENFKNHMFPDLDSLRPIILGGKNPEGVKEMELTQEIAVDLAMELFDITSKNKISTLVESTLSSLNWMDEILQKFLHFEKELIFIYSNPVDCFRRTVELRDRPTSLNFFVKALCGYENFLQVAANCSENIKIYENLGKNNTNPELIYSRKNGELIFQNINKLTELQKSYEKFKGNLN